MAKTAAERMHDYRANLRRQGLKPVQMWVFDTKAPGFKEEAERQAKLIAASDDEKEVMNWIERANADLWADLWNEA
jgi:DNA-binding LacI/PurR family transcriptional regulator